MSAMETRTSGAGTHGVPCEVLLVEDNPGDVRLVKEAFNEVESAMTLQTATDGVEAVEALSRRRDDASEPLPNFVLLDLNLPQMDGFEVLNVIRNDSALSHLPILVLTSSEASEDITRSYDQSANAYLSKPATLDGFVSLVHAIETFWVKWAKLPRASV